MTINKHFHSNSFALDLALKQKLWAARKWPILSASEFQNFPLSMRSKCSTVSMDQNKRTLIPLPVIRSKESTKKGKLRECHFLPKLCPHTEYLPLNMGFLILKISSNRLISSPTVLTMFCSRKGKTLNESNEKMHWTFWNLREESVSALLALYTWGKWQYKKPELIWLSAILRNLRNIRIFMGEKLLLR